MRTCPYCQKGIPEKAFICPFCKKTVGEEGQKLRGSFDVKTTIECENCGSPQLVSLADAGKVVQCSLCRQSFRLPKDLSEKQAAQGGGELEMVEAESAQPLDYRPESGEAGFDRRVDVAVGPRGGPTDADVHRRHERTKALVWVGVAVVVLAVAGLIAVGRAKKAAAERQARAEAAAKQRYEDAKRAGESARKVVFDVNAADAEEFAAGTLGELKELLAKADAAFEANAVEDAGGQFAAVNDKARTLVQAIGEGVRKRQAAQTAREKAKGGFEAVDPAKAGEAVPEEYAEAKVLLAGAEETLAGKDYDAAKASFTDVAGKVSQMTAKIDAHFKAKEEAARKAAEHQAAKDDLIEKDFRLLAGATRRLKRPCAICVLSKVYGREGAYRSGAEGFAQEVADECNALTREDFTFATLPDGEEIMGEDKGGVGDTRFVALAIGPYRRRVSLDKSAAEKIETRKPTQEELARALAAFICEDYETACQERRALDAAEALGRLRVLKEKGILGKDAEAPLGQPLDAAVAALVLDCIAGAQDVAHTCTECDGSGNVACAKCEGDGVVLVKCGACNGKGGFTCKRCGGGGTQRCGKCNGSGQYTTASGKRVKCSRCHGRGKVKCSCGGDGKVRCRKCNGKGQVPTPCPECGDRGPLKGKIVCAKCKGTGITPYGMDPPEVVALRKKYLAELSKKD